MFYFQRLPQGTCTTIKCIIDDFYVYLHKLSY